MGRSLTKTRSRTAYGVLTLAVLSIVVYWPASHGGFVWDDDRYVTNNYLLIASDGLRRIWFSLDAPSQYFPLTYTLLRMERSLWGLNATGYHWANIVFHFGNALLVWRVLARLGVPGNWLAAAIFAVHPVQVESVAWISELKNVLMGFFFLLTLLAWIEYIDSSKEQRRFFYSAAILLYALALFAKSTACTLPAALVLILWWKQKPIGRKTLLEIFPFVVLAVGVGLLAVWWEQYHQGTRMLVSLTPLERLIIAGRAVWFYLGKIFWPSHLTFIYPQWQISTTDPISYLPLMAALLAGTLIYFTRSVFGRGPLVAALFFVATLGPLLGLFMLYTFRYTFVADHYQYLASIGPIALSAAALAQLGKKIPVGFVAAIAAGIVSVLGTLAWLQSATYHDAETLWRSTLSKNRACWMALNNLGVLELEQGKTDGAIADYEQALALHQDYPEAHYNLASALLKTGEIDRALRECEKALALLPNDPDAHVVLGNAYMAKNDVPRAISEYERALSLRPEDFNAHYNLGVALNQNGQSDRAAREFEKAREFGGPDQH